MDGARHGKSAYLMAWSPSGMSGQESRARLWCNDVAIEMENRLTSSSTTLAVLSSMLNSFIASFADTGALRIDCIGSRMSFFTKTLHHKVEGMQLRIGQWFATSSLPLLDG